MFLLAGPTASGKSAAAIQIAKALGGEIVGADSMQIYRDLPVLTARPSAEDEAAAPHHLVGVADAAEAWSVGRWLEAAKLVLQDLAARGRPAVVAGGTGLYFRALVQGLAETPPIPETARAAVEAEYDALGEAAVRAALKAVDPQAEGRIAPRDRQRLVRALAVARHTGRALSAWQADTAPVLRPGEWRGVVLEPPRQVLYARCDARLGAMIEHGALDELRAFLSRGLPDNAPLMKAVGVRELAASLRGEASLESAVEAARQATRNYAKRQLTWFRNQTPDWERADDVGAAVTLAS